MSNRNGLPLLLLCVWFPVKKKQSIAIHARTLLVQCLQVVVVAILALRHFTRPGETKPNLYLTLSGKKSEEDCIPQITKVLAKEARDFRLRRIDETKELFEISFQIQFKDIEHIQSCRTALASIHPEIKISLIDDRGIGG